ncbi:hypothetical protein E5Q_05483 [Mixia osmundae IAM 14324]|uniref:LIM zinc-binding domain-containing protein n=1 Tax=Mixia osmundae (strain CBS 9802 / IAM 14324 / JCM 22182 / KY 12970) TaxID=764103 RepID=G7E7I5_MIXOS|nr:hypothetical protein E5Q_05483 [Mixia osmundae IAM 14324]
MAATSSPSAYRSAPRQFVSNAPECARCGKRVYFAEQVLGPASRPYHRPCLSCLGCKKTLQPGALVDHEGDPYCKHCHSRAFGPKGVGFGSAMLAQYETKSGQSSPVPSPKIDAISRPTFGFDDIRDDRRAPLASGSPSAYAPGSPSNLAPQLTSQSRSPSPLPKSSPGPAPTRVLGAPEQCSRCGSTVYFAERTLAVGKVWHKRCLRCAGDKCGKALDSHLLESNGLPYCKSCHSRLEGGVQQQGFVRRF